MNKHLIILLLITTVACNTPQKENATQVEQKEQSISEPDQLNSLTEAHQITEFHQKEVVAFDIELYFRGKLRLAGTIYSRTNSTAVLVNKTDGSQLLFDGQEVYISPDTASTKAARFDALTWSYFALAPFKFKDEGTHCENNDLLPLDSGQTDYQTLKLTFGENVGDAPDDWYIIFQDEETALLSAMAYIVTFGDTPQEEAAKSPHAITYSDYTTVEGIPFATAWNFYNWNATDGLGSQLGEAKLKNIQFISESDTLFSQPENSKLVPLK